ncbi:MAG: hypothetical protein EPO65_13520 [Dehalococcoidia bacterium]|nr:MAG: hypothetical protein EPO65_13520 [Dehalococcoidia bacterium]
MNPLHALSKKNALLVMAVLAGTTVSCICQSSEEVLRTPTPTSKASTAAAPATSTASPGAAATSGATATASASPATGASTATAAARQAVRLRGVLGVDHPPFAQNYGVGGNSVGMACLSGIPTGGTVTIQINGGTGAPPSILGSGGADGTVIIPFPIQQFGMMNASITGLRVNGQPTNFQADAFSYTVGSQDLICTPPR